MSSTVFFMLVSGIHYPVKDLISVAYQLTAVFLTQTRVECNSVQLLEIY